jgi:hypothetical protein
LSVSTTEIIDRELDLIRDNRRLRIFSPYSLISWWDMQTFPVQKFLVFVRNFQKMVGSSSESAQFQLTDKARLIEIEALMIFAAEFETYSLQFTAAQLRRMAELLKKGGSPRQLNDMIPDLINRLEDECSAHIMLMIEPSHATYIEDPLCFDSNDSSARKVSTQFSSAAEDIAESGVCLALGRSTACVMHLQRVMEVGLQSLAAALSIPKQNDWGSYLRQIETELQQRLKRSGARSEDEQFYAEVKVTFDAVRRAWRNPTMHPEKVYTVERAEEILISVRSFMRHLATKLHD